jgi:hypothetical protein
VNTKKTRAIYQLKVTLCDIEPPVWRGIQVWENARLPQLHRILQSIFNWENYHLHEFIAGRRTYGVPDPEDAIFGRKVFDERLVALKAVVERVGATFEYLYDFGDNWRHEIVLEAILLPDAEASYPRCVAGARNGPPEDTGGPYRYANYLEALADSAHPEHEDLLAWRGPFNPEAFSRSKINAALQRTFHRPPRVHIGRTIR